ncbi:tetratricopeptide repeat protein [Aquipuribacter nitratireducens]|uniref:Tetratricopeptide repeat protein n=1 Tax=Aquipuribacter nitratireducens TaxID=650104 RepID=A0ABW0GSH4_9MICO
MDDPRDTTGPGPGGGTPQAGRPAGGTYEWLSRGRELLAAGDAQAAATVLRHAHEDEPGSPDVLETLARAEFESGRFEEARRLFAALVEREPDSDYARFGLGASLVRLARAREAEPHLALAAAMRPDRSEYVGLLQRARASLGRDRPDAGRPT